MHPAFLQMVQRFAQLTPEDTKKLFDLFGPATIVEKKDHLVKEGHVHDSLYFLANGHVRGYYLKDGTEVTSNFYFGPTFFGDLASIKHRSPTRLNIQALEDVELYAAYFADVEKLAADNTAIMRLFYNFVEHLYLFHNNRQLSFLYDTPAERYQKLFKERPKVIANVPLQYIASYLGINPETLSRIRKKMTQQ